MPLCSGTRRRLLNFLKCKTALTNADISHEPDKPVNVVLAVGLFLGTLVILFILTLIYHCITLLRYRHQGKDHLWEEMIARSDAQIRERLSSAKSNDTDSKPPLSPGGPREPSAIEVWREKSEVPASPMMLSGARGRPSTNTQLSGDTDMTGLGSPDPLGSPRPGYFSSAPPPYKDDRGQNVQGGRHIPATCHI